MKTYKRNSIFNELKNHCILNDENGYIEITEWKNGEGFDVEVNSTINNRFQLTWGEWKLLKKMVKKFIL